MKQSSALPFTPQSLDPQSPIPLYRQLYDAVREGILSGRLRPGTRLPATRALAEDLGLSRTTVLNAVDQLMAEGYVEGRVGSGTYVASVLPDDLLQMRVGQGLNRHQGAQADSGGRPGDNQTAPGSGRAASERRVTRVSRRGRLFVPTFFGAPHEVSEIVPFRAGVPALDAFPTELWATLIARRMRDLSPELMTYGDSAGYRPLREAIAAYLATARAVRCTPEQVIVVAGSQGAIDLIARVLLDPDDAVWVENPGYTGSREAFAAAGARVVPVPVDDEGLDVRAGAALCPDARLVYVTPSHQFPLGMVMTLTRRLALLRWAREADAWIVEDDYDSEYRYAGRPLAALQGLDDEQRVIYIGTFSKVLFPALRLGYLVVPPDLVDPFVAARTLADRGSPTLLQAVLADFVAEGHFARHIRRTRTLYAERQQALVTAAARHLQGLLHVPAQDTGMHLIGWLPPGIDARVASQAMAARGVDARPLSVTSAGDVSFENGFSVADPSGSGRGGLILGYTGYDPGQIEAAVLKMRAALDDLLVRSSSVS